ncbi:hypothetical protein [Hahella sp. HN01]|uniref:hypothetical protein n=1 Tax=Hahella sp. HN01 TaxID=2847262 RepID=UPI001C1EB5F2|nr:hypothetical protein [Hahella sp. HN01]MBU6951239.1 hypothetical protein [Hahella sp. HN01]
MYDLSLKVKGFQNTASAKHGSCLAQCETLAGKIFVDTDQRCDLYALNAMHYHLRLPSKLIVDPTISQFFDVPPNYQPEVFVGDMMDLKRCLSDMMARFGIAKHHRAISDNMSSVDQLLTLWSTATAKKTGDRLVKHVGSASGRIRAYYS